MKAGDVGNQASGREKCADMAQSLPEHWEERRRDEHFSFSLIRKERFGGFIVIFGLLQGHSLHMTEKERC